MTQSNRTDNVVRLGTLWLLFVTRPCLVVSDSALPSSPSTGSSNSTAYNLTTQASQSAASGDPSLNTSLSRFPGPHANRRTAYSRWRNWLLTHPALLDKVPPKPKSALYAEEDGLPVIINLTPFNILDVDVARQTATLAFKLDVSWMDPALALNSHLIDQFTEGNTSSLPFSIVVPSAFMWKPSLRIAEGVSAQDMLEDVEEVQVSADGNVTILSPTVLSFACRFDMDAYPFDQHECPVSFFDVSGTSKLFLSDVPWEKSISDRYGVAGEWTLVDMGHAYADDGYTPRFTLHLKRETTFYVIVVIMPMVLTSYLNVLVFFLPPDLGDKMSYLVTITISMSVYSSFFNQDMPRGLHTVPAIFYLLVFVFAEAFVTMLMSLVVLRKYHYEQEQQHHQQGQREKPDVMLPPFGKGVKIHPEETERNAVTFPEVMNGNGLKNSDLGEGGSVKLPETEVRGGLAGWKVRAKTLDFVFFLIVFTVNTLAIVVLLGVMV